MGDVATEIGNIWRLLNERLLPPKSAEIKTTDEDAAAAIATRADR
jgi:hypothetical protein